MNKLVILKHRLARFLNFIFLLPFIIAYRPLFARFDMREMIWYSLGVLIILLIIIFSNRQAYITLEEEKLILNLHYYQSSEIHNLDRITLVESMTRHSCRIHSRDYKPVRLTMNPGDLDQFLKALDKRNIKIKAL